MRTSLIGNAITRSSSSRTNDRSSRTPPMMRFLIFLPTFANEISVQELLCNPQMTYCYWLSSDFHHRHLLLRLTSRERLQSLCNVGPDRIDCRLDTPRNSNCYSVSHLRYRQSMGTEDIATLGLVGSTRLFGSKTDLYTFIVNRIDSFYAQLYTNEHQNRSISPWQFFFLFRL
jgi:hypothetical protein